VRKTAEVGALATVVRGYKADAAVIMEPTELMIAPAQAGALNFVSPYRDWRSHGRFVPRA